MASQNPFAALADEGEDVPVQQAPAPAPAKSAAKGKAAAPAAAPATSPAAPNRQAEEPVEQKRSSTQGSKDPRPYVPNSNSRHVSRNGQQRTGPQGGKGKGANNPKLDDENFQAGPNSKKTAAIVDASDKAEANNEAAAEPASEAAENQAAAAPEAPKEEDPADKLIGFDDYLASKVAKRVAGEEIKPREVTIDDKFWKAGSAVVSQKDAVSDFKDLVKQKKDKKEKGGSKRAVEAIEFAPQGVVQQPAARDANSPRGDGPRGSPRDGASPRGGRGGFRGRGGRGGRGGGGSRGGAVLKAEDFPSLVPGSQ